MTVLIDSRHGDLKALKTAIYIFVVPIALLVIGAFISYFFG